MSDAYSISIHDQPNPNDVRAIEDGLRKFNLQYAPPDYFHFVIHTPGLAGEVARTEKSIVSRSRLEL